MVYRMNLLGPCTIEFKTFGKPLMSHESIHFSRTGQPWQTAAILVALILLSSLLSGCVGTLSNISTPRQISVAAIKSDEEVGWAQVSRLSQSECGVTPEPPAREQAVSQSTCVTTLVEKHVLPLAAFPDLLKESRKDALQLAKRYERGQLSLAEYQSQSQARLRRYREEWRVRVAARKDHPEDAKFVNF